MPEAPWTKRCAHVKIAFSTQSSKATQPKFFDQKSARKTHDDEAQSELIIRNRIRIDFTQNPQPSKRESSLASDLDNQVLLDQMC